MLQLSQLTEDLLLQLLLLLTRAHSVAAVIPKVRCKLWVTCTTVVACTDALMPDIHACRMATQAPI